MRHPLHPCYPFCFALRLLKVYPVGIPAWYAWLLFSNRHRIFPKQALKDGVPAERRLTDRKIAHTVFLWEVHNSTRRCERYALNIRRFIGNWNQTVPAFSNILSL